MSPVRATAVLALLLVSSPMAWPQVAALNPAASPASVSALPEPYGPDEFPSWLSGARRFEIISLGAFPILLFYTRVAFDVRRWVGNGFDATYAPWPFRNENSYEPTDGEQAASLLTAAGLSVVFGAIDAILMVRLGDR